METMVSIFIDKFKVKRITSCIISFAIIILVGMLSVLGYSSWSNVTIFGYQFLDLFDFASNNIMMPIVALLTCILIGWVVKPKCVEDEILCGEKKFSGKVIFNVMIKFFCPVGMIIILLTSLFVKF